MRCQTGRSSAVSTSAQPVKCSTPNQMAWPGRNTAVTTVSTAAQPSVSRPFLSGARESVKLNPAMSRKLQQIYYCQMWQPGALISYQAQGRPKT